MRKICKWCDHLHMNMIFRIWRSNFIAIWNLAGICFFFKLHFTLEDSGLNHRTHMGTLDGVYTSCKDSKCRRWHNAIIIVVFCNWRKYFCNNFSLKHMTSLFCYPRTSNHMFSLYLYPNSIRSMQMGDTTVIFNHFLHIYLAVYDKWTSEIEGNVNGEIT